MISNGELPAALLLVGGALALAWAAAMPLDKQEPASMPPAASTVPSAPRTVAESIASRVVTNNVFRISRRPSAAPYRAEAGEAGSAATLPRPTLRLVGLLLGDTARALVEGLPGRDRAAMVRAGETVAGFRIAGVTRSGVRIVGADTTWSLTLRRLP